MKVSGGRTQKVFFFQVEKLSPITVKRKRSGRLPATVASVQPVDVGAGVALAGAVLAGVVLAGVVLAGEALAGVALAVLGAGAPSSRRHILALLK